MKHLFYQLGRAQRQKPKNASDADQVTRLLVRYLHHCNGTPDPSLVDDVKALLLQWEHCRA